MSKLVDIYAEISKHESQKTSAEGRLSSLKDDYRRELVSECIGNLLKIKEEENQLTERDMTIYINNLTTDVRNLYIK